MQRKICLVLCFALLASSAAFSNPIGFTRARSLAQSVLKGKVLTAKDAGGETKSRDGKSLPAFYVFNAENEGGFAIISGDDRVSPVLGYSSTGTFNADNMHPSLEAYLQHCAEYISAVREGVAEASTRASEQVGTIIVNALCKTQWGQDVPFNKYCPQFGGVAAPCGCVATAASQIMRYWEWPSSGRGSIMYNSSGYGILSRDFSQSTYDWSIMRNKGGMIRDPKVNEAMGTLCYDVGLSVKMEYAAGGSGAFDEDIRVSLPKYFKYKASTIDLLRRDCFESSEAWMNAVKKELNAGRPIICCAQDTLSGGHAFIIDGYDSNDFVHVNWGWDGMSDGFYNIETLAPDDTRWQFSEMQTLIVGIMPDPTEQDSQSKQYKMYLQNAPESEGTVDLGSDFWVKYSNLIYLGNGSSFFTAGVGLFDAEGNFLKEISKESTNASASYTQQYKSYYILRSLNVAASIGKGEFPDGKYAIRGLFQERGFSDWALPDVVGGSQLNWIPVVIKNGKITLNSPDGPSVPNAIEGISLSDAQPASVAYYDLHGRRLSSPQKGSIVIKHERFGDGSSSSRKVFVK